MPIKRNIKNAAIALALTLGFSAAASALPDENDVFSLDVKTDYLVYGCTKDRQFSPIVMRVYPSLSDMKRLNKEFPAIETGRYFLAAWQAVASTLTAGDFSGQSPSKNISDQWRRVMPVLQDGVEEETGISIRVGLRILPPRPSADCQ